jgi:hypothetical protein
MRALVFLFMLAVSLPAFAAEPAAGIWYEGGTLQKADIAAWVDATPENQLATSADFIASLSGLTEIAVIKDPKELAEIRKRSESLRECINAKIAEDETSYDTPVAHVVVFCTILKK